MYNGVSGQLRQALRLSRPLDSDNTVVINRNGTLIVYLHDKLIAKYIAGSLLYVTFAGQNTATTVAHLNDVLDVLTKNWRASVYKGVGMFRNKFEGVKVAGSVYISPLTGRKRGLNEKLPPSFWDSLEETESNPFT